MSNPTITERWSGDEVTQTSPDAKNYTLTADRTLDIIVDDPQNWNSFAIASWLSDPDIRAAYAVNGIQIDFYLKCNNLKISRTAPGAYVVSANYFTNAQLGQSPLNNPPDISFGSIVTEDDMHMDANGAPIITVTGEDFDPPPRTPVYDVVVHVSRNVAAYDDSWAQTYRNTVNSAPWNNYPAGAVRLVTLTGTSVLDNSFQYWRVSAEFQIRNPYPDSNAPANSNWFKAIKAMGFMVKVGSTIQRAQVNMQDSPVPVPHDPSTGAYISNPALAKYYYFQEFQLRDFNQLGLI